MLNDEVLIRENFLPLSLGNSYIILGIEWLEKLGTVKSNWKLQTMSYQMEGRTVELRGDPSLARTRISLKAMIQTLCKEGGGVLLELNELEAGEGKKYGKNWRQGN